MLFIVIKTQDKAIIPTKRNDIFLISAPKHKLWYSLANEFLQGHNICLHGEIRKQFILSYGDDAV